MKTAIVLTVAVLSLACTHSKSASDPHAGHDMTAQSAPASEYPSMMEREVKALSKEETAGLLEGRGLGMAMPAELNGYPGPMHVLELQEGLGLSAEQVKKTEELFNQVKAESKSLGRELVEAEKRLDLLFKEKTATEQNLSEATASAAALRGRLRETHLKFHLRMMEVLSTQQIVKYSELRGYSGSSN